MLSVRFVTPPAVLLLTGCSAAVLPLAGPKHGCESDIHSAAQLGDIKEVGRLIDRGRDPNSRACAFPPPIFNALDEQRIPMIRYLVARGAQVDIRHRQESANDPSFQPNHTPLMAACSRAAYSHNGFAADSRGHVNVMNALIDLGADVNAKDRSSPVSILCWDKQSLSVLAARGANLNAEATNLYIRIIGYSVADADGAWQLGVRPNLDEVAMHYLRYHIGVPEKSQGALSPKATGWNVPITDILNELKKRGFYPSAAQRRGYRPVHRVVLQEGTGLLQWLLANGADPNERDERGETPLRVLAGSRMAPEPMKVRSEMLRAYGAS